MKLSMAGERNESRQETHRRLWLAMADAQRDYLQAVKDQNAIIADVPSGLPAEDGVFRLDRKGIVRQAAFRRYAMAVEEFHAFLKGRP